MNLGPARIQRADSARKGGILVLFALLTFVFLAVAGLVIDVGLANLTQSQMQAAVDSAALEGCRWRNFDEGLGDSNTQKRRKAAAMVRLAFDDDFHPTQGAYTPDGMSVPLGVDGPDEGNIGAGPGLRVSGGTGAWAANAIVDNQPDSELARIDDPRLQTNNANRPQGDMVAGRFKPMEPHTETGGYARPDFQVAPAGTASVNSLSFLARMRRAGDANPNDTLNGVSSSLPTLPIVFGMGSTILQDPDGNGWDPRRDGITVRATAIASARPAMRVGRAPCDASGALLYDHEPDTSGSSYREHISGLVPFFIYRDAWVSHFRGAGWQASSSSASGRVRVEADGRLVLDSGGATVGHFLFDAASAPANPCDPEVGWPENIGYAVPRATAAPVRGFRYTTRKPAYIAIVESIPDENNQPVLRVVGYGFAHLWPVGYVPNGTTPPPTAFPGTGTFAISAGELINHPSVNCWIAQDNVSAILDSAADEYAITLLPAPQLRRVLELSNELAYGTATPDPLRIHDYTYIQRGTVLAPALTR